MPKPRFQELRKAFQCHQLALMLRSVLFLTCFTAILHHAKLLDSVDVLALKFLPENAFEQKPWQDNASFRTLVLGITPDLFEQEFGGHTPINRDRFRKLIQDVVIAYPKARVLAVDYDFSPSGVQPCAFNGESSVCEIAKLEAQQQKSFEEFLRTELSDKHEPPRVQLVLITPLQDLKELNTGKGKWLVDMTQAGVRFGDHALLEHNWLATVVKHLHVKPLADPCAHNGDIKMPFMPFAAVVNEARRCAGLPVTLDAEGHEAVELINFAEARNSVFLCPLWEWSDIKDGCKKRLRSANSDFNVIDTIFIGSLYGEEDKFRTPLGDQYGVELQAFGAYSQIDPLDELKYWSFAIDMLIGLLSAIVFQILWASAMHSVPQSKCRFFFISMVFVVLILAAWVLAWNTPNMLKNGIWMNPMIILVGLFIHSYASVIERVGEHKSHAHAHAKPSSYLFTVMPAQSNALASINRTPMRTQSRLPISKVFARRAPHSHAHAKPSLRDVFQTFIGWPPPPYLAHERVFQLCKKVLFYWGVVLYGLYLHILD